MGDFFSGELLIGCEGTADCFLKAGGKDLTRLVGYKGQPKNTVPCYSYIHLACSYFSGDFLMRYLCESLFHSGAITSAGRQ